MWLLAGKDNELHLVALVRQVDDVATEVDGERELVLTGGAKNALVNTELSECSIQSSRHMNVAAVGRGATVLLECNDRL